MMISFRRCSQRTLPKQEFEHLTLCSSKVRQLRRAAPRTKPGRGRRRIVLFLWILPRLKKRTAGMSSSAEISPAAALGTSPMPRAVVRPGPRKSCR